MKAHLWMCGRYLESQSKCDEASDWYRLNRCRLTSSYVHVVYSDVSVPIDFLKKEKKKNTSLHRLINI